jgi:hypothetical protein
MNAGVKRLAILLGIVGALAWFILNVVFLMPSRTSLREWEIVVASTLVLFIVPFALVYCIAWVIRGFRLVSRERERKPRAEESEDDE